MNRLFLYITFACLTGITFTSGTTAIAGGCTNNLNKKAKIECSSNDNDCQKEKTDKFDLNETVRSWDMTEISLIIHSAPRDLTEFVFFLVAGFTAGSLGLI